MKSGIRTSTRPGVYQEVPRPDPVRVLVVDDFDDTREMYSEFLAFVGFRVEAAADARTAIASARRSAPAVIIMDLSLPDMSGSEAAKILRRDRRTQKVPIIAVTAFTATHARDVALRAGCDVFLEKPVGPNDLAAQITDLLARTERGRPPGA